MKTKNTFEYKSVPWYTNFYNFIAKWSVEKIVVLVVVVVVIVMAIIIIIIIIIKGLEDLEVGRRVETIQTTALLRTTRILRRVLETWGDLLSLRPQWKTIG